jgi:phage-related protein
MPKLFDNATNTQGVIVYGGESSSGYGMVVAEAPAYERPKRKETIYTVPGRNGAIIFQEDAWEDVPRTYKVWLAEDSNDSLVEKVDAFEAWLNAQNGYTRLEDNFEPDVYRLAYYSGGIGFTNNLTQYGEATLSFTCRAERFLKSGETAVTVTNGYTLVNPTKFASKPLIHIEATNQTVSITIKGKTITAEVADYINIDCDQMNAYRLVAENRNSKISGPFPTIAPGNNTITITGTTSLVTITPRYFSI